MKLGWKHDDISRYKMALERAWKKKKRMKICTFWFYRPFNYLVSGPSIILSHLSPADDIASAKDFS